MQLKGEMTMIVDLICGPGKKVFWLNRPPKSLRGRCTPLIHETEVISVIIKKNRIIYQTVTASKTEVTFTEKDLGIRWFLTEQEAKTQVDKIWEEMRK